MRTIFVLMGLVIVFSFGTATAQTEATCEDPFAGMTVRFSRGSWTQTDFCQRSIDLTEVLSGGPPPNGIPPIGFPAVPEMGINELPGPQFETIAEAQTWLQPQSPVIALSIAGEARAYPLAILMWHEIVNDTIGETPVAVTFCPLCNSSIVFDRRVGEATLFFGTTGNLRNSDLIMWDDQTQSWWQQFTGEAIVGRYTGEMLSILPSQVVGFRQFTEQFPQGMVLSRETGAPRSYGINPYTGYDSGEPFLFEGQVDPRLPATARVLGTFMGQDAVAYPYELLQTQQVINDTVNDIPVVALWQPGMVSALDAAQIDDSQEIGTAAVFNRGVAEQTLSFIVTDGAITDEQTGSTWNAFGTATAGELLGTQLEQLPGATYFWFAWAAFRPETTLFGR
jgi:hypothetical protein